MQKKRIVYCAEYYEPKLDKWIRLHERLDFNEKELQYHANFPIIGNPVTRIAMYEKIGTKKFHYKIKHHAT